MSLHSENVAAAIANHRAYFGENANSPNRVEYRPSEEFPWVSVDNAVVHGEFVATVRNGMQSSRQTRRHIFCDLSQISERTNAHVRIGGQCGQVYTVVEFTRKGDRMQLHCVRHALKETTRPNYRSQNGRR